MINGISSSYSSYTSSTAIASSQSKRFQEALLSKLDTDEDGSISKEELSSALSNDSKDGITVSLSEAFSTLDSDEDESLSAEELAAFAPPPPPQQNGFDVASLAEDLLGSLDADGDGSISSDELTTGLSNAGSSADSSKVFSALDTNEDGTVSLEELTAALQPQQPPAGPPPNQAVSSNSSTIDTDALFSALDSNGDSSISVSELTSALQQSSSSQTSNANQISAEALNKMIAALGERYDTDGSKPVGRYLDTAA